VTTRTSTVLASFLATILLKMVRRNDDLNAVFYSFFVILRGIRSRFDRWVL